MVVLSAAVLTKGGRTLFARQFVEMNRLRIEGLLAAFPKLVGGNKQHTFIETDSVRYVYQPLEGLVLLLITNKASNIVEDLDTLRLLSKVVPEFAGGTSEEKVADKAFELVFAFDEVITPGGYREYIDLRTVRQNLEMDSHEEKLHNMVQKTKMDSAKDQALQMQKQIKARQREAQKTGVSSGMTGIGGGTPPTDTTPVVISEAPPPAPAAPAFPEQPAIQVKSLKLGQKKSTSLVDRMAAEDGLKLNAAPSSSSSKKKTEDVAPAAHVPLTVAIEEKLTCQLSQEGALEQFDLKGALTVTANEELNAKLQIGDVSGTFQVHPKVDKKLWETTKCLQLKKGGLPVGRAVGVLRWSLNTQDESFVPLVVNCWPEDEGDQYNVNIEYQLQRSLELHNVDIEIPLGSSAHPKIVTIDGSHRVENETLIWSLPMIDDSNASGTLEFNIATDGDFFPINVTFQSKTLYHDVPILAVVNADGANVPFSASKALTVDTFKIN